MASGMRLKTELRTAPKLAHCASPTLIRLARCPHRHVQAGAAAPKKAQQSAALPTASAWQAERQQIKQELRQRLSQLAASQGPMAALLPGLPEEKAAVDALLQRLQGLPKADELALVPSINDAVLGEWELVYASNGTVVTRTPVAHALVSMGKALPGAGLSDIRQTIRRGAGNQGIEASNEVVLGLGPLGSWKLGIVGRWISQGDTSSVRVVFDRVNVELAGVMGLPVPRWLPKIPISFGSVDRQATGGADWITTYCDDDMRIGKGKASGNIFLFFKKL